MIDPATEAGRDRAAGPPSPAKLAGLGSFTSLADPRERGRWSLCEQDVQEHVLISGAPGSGKTNLMIGIVGQLRARGHGAVIVDLKGDHSLPDALGADQRFALGPTANGAWNPLAGDDPASWRDVLLSSYEWTEPFYRDAASRFAAALLDALAALEGTVRIEQAIPILESPLRGARLVGELRRRGEERRAAALESAIAVTHARGSDRAIRSGVVGLGNRLAALVNSPAIAGRLSPQAGEPQVDLDAALKDGACICFSLPAASYPQEAPALAGAVISALSARAQSSAAGGTVPLRCALLVDEAAQLSGEQLRRAVAIARGAGMGVILASQDLRDLEQVSPGTVDAIMTGCSTWVIFRQTASAEPVAAAFGSYKRVERTRQLRKGLLLSRYTGAESHRLVAEPYAHPNLIRGLPRGTALAYHRSSAYPAPWRAEVRIDPR